MDYWWGSSGWWRHKHSCCCLESWFHNGDADAGTWGSLRWIKHCPHLIAQLKTGLTREGFINVQILEFMTPTEAAVIQGCPWGGPSWFPTVPPYFYSQNFHPMLILHVKKNLFSFTTDLSISALFPQIFHMVLTDTSLWPGINIWFPCRRCSFHQHCWHGATITLWNVNLTNPGLNIASIQREERNKRQLLTRHPNSRDITNN